MYFGSATRVSSATERVGARVIAREGRIVGDVRIARSPAGSLRAVGAERMGLNPGVRGIMTVGGEITSSSHGLASVQVYPAVRAVFFSFTFVGTLRSACDSHDRTLGQKAGRG